LSNRQKIHEVSIHKASPVYSRLVNSCRGPERR